MDGRGIFGGCALLKKRFAHRVLHRCTAASSAARQPLPSSNVYGIRLALACSDSCLTVHEYTTMRVSVVLACSGQSLRLTAEETWPVSCTRERAARRFREANLTACTQLLDDSILNDVVGIVVEEPTVEGARLRLQALLPCLFLPSDAFVVYGVAVVQ